MDACQACVHFLRKSERKHAIAITNGAKFANTRIYVESCRCVRSFSRVSGSKPAGNIAKLPKNPKYHSEEPSAVEITATVIQADDDKDDESAARVKTNHKGGTESNKRDVPAPLSGSPRTCANTACRKCKPLTKNTLQIHGVKVSNLHYATTNQEVKEHFRSCNFEIAEVAVHTRNARDTIACVHFHNEKDRLLAIRETNGSLLYGREIKVEPCCCKRSLREKGYGKRSSTKVSSETANGATKGICSCAKCTKASVLASGCLGTKESRPDLSVKRGGSQAPSTITPPNSEAPTINTAPLSTAKRENSEAPTVSVAPPSTVEAAKTEAPTISSIPPSSVPDSYTKESDLSCTLGIVGPETNTAPSAKNDHVKCSSAPSGRIKPAIVCAKRTKTGLPCGNKIGSSVSKAPSTVPSTNASNTDVPVTAIGTVALPMGLCVMIPLHAPCITSSLRGLGSCGSGGAEYCLKALLSYFAQKNLGFKK